MTAVPCEHHKPGAFVRLDLLAGYAEVGLICVHGYMVDTVNRPDQLEPDRRPADHQDAPAPDVHRANAPTLQ